MHVLVTGAAGLTGSEIVRHLLRHGHRVTAVVGTTHGRLSGHALHGEFQVLQGDLASDLDLPNRLDAVVHAAARSPGPAVGAAQIVHDNVVATLALVDHAKRAGAKTFVFLSSLSVYGRIQEPVVDERTPICDPEVYGLSKRIGEELLAAAAGSFRSISIRLPGVLGRESGRNWLSTVMSAARAGDDIVVYNPNASFNNAVHVQELSRFVRSLVEGEWHGVDVVTVGARGHTTVKEAVEYLVQAFGGRSKVSISPQAKTSFMISSDRAQMRYGYEALQMTEMLHRFAEENSPPR